MTRSVRAAALRSTALATGLIFVAALSVATEAWANPKVPLPKPRPIARNVVPKTTSAVTPAAPGAAATSAAPVAAAPATAPAPAPHALAPATRQHAAVAPARKQVAPAAMAATSSTSQADKQTLENVIELIRKRQPDEATQLAAGLEDSVAKKLAEWLILRSENNNVTVERYRAFIAQNPSWPSQTFMRRRLEAALWDDKRDDAAVWAWFENQSPISAKGRLSLAKAMIARGDRTNAERLVRQAWRSDRMSEDTESNALDMFGAFLTAGDHKARMDTLLYGTENEAAGTRAAKRLGAGHVALAKARIAANHKGGNLKALLDAVPRELHSDPGYVFARIQMLRRDEKFSRGRAAHDERAEGSEPPAQSGRMVDRAAPAGAQDDRHQRIPHRLSDRPRRRASGARHLQDRAGIHRRLDRAALPQRSRGRRAAFCANRRRQRQPDRAGARRLLAGPRRRGRRPGPGSARRLSKGGRAIDQLLRPAGARQTRTAAARDQRRAFGPRPQRRAAGDRPRRAIALRARRGRIRDPDPGRHGRERRSGRAGRARRTGLAPQRRPRHAADGQGRAQSRAAVRLLRLSRERDSVVQGDRAGGRARASSTRSPGRKAPSTRRWCRRRRPMG